jgi:membrane-bound metal-dependent hydrolase YbcI (DUF457 family)
MDFFTHMLMGYLIGWGYSWGVSGYNEYLILLSVVMSMFPDFDVIFGLIPAKYRKGRAFKHRGITHSVLFIFVVSCIVTYLFNLAWGVPLLHGFVVAVLGGLSHLLLDGLTAFPFPFLAPFTWKEYSADIDFPVTWYMMVFSPTMIIAMWYARSVGLHIDYFVWMVWAVFIVLGAHYIARIGVRALVKRRYAGQGHEVKVYHRFFLLKPYVVVTRKVGEISVACYDKVDLLRGRTDAGRFFEVSSLAPPPISPKTREEAIVHSASALRGNGFNEENRENISALMLDEKPSAWEVFWFDWKHWHPWRPVPGLKVRVDENGALEASPFATRVVW